MFVNVKAQFGTKFPVTTRVSIPLNQFTTWELEAADYPNNTLLKPPAVGRNLDIAIMGLYNGVKVTVESVYAIPLYPVLHRALQGVPPDGVIHNFIYPDYIPLVFALFSEAVIQG